MSYLISFLLFGLSFIVLPFGTSPFETPKVIIGEVLLSLIVLFGLPKENILSRNYLKLFYPYFLLVLLIVISLIFHFTPTTLFGNAFRMQGLFMLILLCGFSIVTAKTKTWIPSPDITLLLLIGHFVLSFFISGNTERAIGTLGEPNALAASVLFLLPFAVFTNKKEKKWWISVSAFMVTLLIVLMSGSRSGLIGFGIECVFFVISQRLILKKSLIVCLSVLVLSWSLPFFNTEQLYENRADIWTTAITAGTIHPLTGWGIGNTDQALMTTIGSVKNNLRGYYVDSSHNLFLDWWVQGGIAGVIAITWLIWKTCNMFVKDNNKQRVLLLLGLLTALTFNPVSIVTLIQFWWLLGKGFQTKAT